MVTSVNTLVSDFFAWVGYPTADMGMIYPNRLGELMASKNIRDVDLAELAGTTKQQIGRLKKGERQLTRKWAERLHKHLGVEWIDVIGWNPADTQTSTESALKDGALRAIGKRVVWARTYRDLSREEAARRFQIPRGRLQEIEAGASEMTIFELATISGHLRIQTDFLLRGEDTALPWQVAEDYRASAQSSSPSNGREPDKGTPKPQHKG